jgi:hypothetical protein
MLDVLPKIVFNRSERLTERSDKGTFRTLTGSHRSDELREFLTVLRADVSMWINAHADV